MREESPHSFAVDRWKKTIKCDKIINRRRCKTDCFKIFENTQQRRAF